MSSRKIFKSNWYLERQGIEYSIGLLQGCNKVGRKLDSHITISGSNFISREHCEINVFPSHIELTDHSSNGTYINEQQILNKSKILTENDKIGVGVDDLNDDPTDSQYHVYVLKRKNNSQKESHRKSVIMVPSIIDLVDSDSEESLQNEPIIIKNKEVAITRNESNSVTNSDNSVKNCNTNRKHGDKTHNVRIISDIVIPRKNIISDYQMETLAINENSKKNVKLLQTNTIEEESQLENEDKFVNNEFIDTKIKNASDVPSTSINRKCSRAVPSTSKCSSEEKVLKQKQIYTIDIVSDDEVTPISSKAITTNLNNSIVFEISDDEEFQCSQFLVQDIKQEINDFYFEDEINNKISPIQNYDNDEDKHEKLASPVYDLLTDDNDGEDAEEFDENLANWYIKLSQSMVKQELKEEENEVENNKIIQLNAEISDSLQSKHVATNKFLPEKIVTDLPEKIVTDVPEDENRNNYKIEKNKIPQLIDAPCLPTHKGKLRGVSAEGKSKPSLLENIKKSIIKTDKKRSREKDLKEKWLCKPNKSKEKNQIKKIRNDRIEKLKQLADRDRQKINISEPKDTRALKKPKVKITNQNRGAFLTEIPSHASTSKNPVKRKNSEIEDRSKLKKIPKISVKPSVSATAVNTNCQVVQEQQDKSMTHKNKSNTEEQPQKKLHLKSSTKLDVEKRPEKLRFKSLRAPDDTTSKIQTLTKTKTLKSILLTKSKSQQQRIVKKVRFNEKPLIKYYDVEITDETIIAPKKLIQKDLSFNLTLLSERKKLRLRTFSWIDHTDSILSEILSWNADWLESGSEEVNGPNHLLMPMLHQFQSLSDYKNTVFPLLKLEMWVHLTKALKTGNENNFVYLSLNGIQIDDKSINKRIIYNCHYSGNKKEPQNLFLTGDLILIQINSYKIFGYVRENSFINNLNKSYFNATIESMFNEKLIPILNIVKKVKVKKLSSITIELGQFNAVSRLKYSPLLKDILNPINLCKKNSISVNNIKYEGYHQNLNDVQKDILLRTYIKCINPREPNITLIEGPPGTGKSRLVTNLTLQILYGSEVKRLDRRILICAPSNAAVDVITLQLIHIRKKMTNLQARFNVVRFGVIERMHPDVRMYSLTGLIEYNRKTERVNIRGLENEKKFIEDKIRILKQNNNQNTVDQDELYKLKQNLNRINCLINPENKNYDSDKSLYPKFLAGAHIICTTLTSCVKLLKYIKFFDVCIIDESTQCSEPWSLIPLQFTINSLILIGDKQQLPATVLSKLSKEYNYGKSLFTRISECLEHNVIGNPILTLRTQYRMHPEICRWPNLYFYKNKLITDSTLNQFKLKIKPYSIFNLEYKQNESKESGNISNTLEATFVVELIKYLKKIMPFEEYKYGIISPYAQHRDDLQKQLKESNIFEVVASTIDSYQGKEKDVIIISNGRTAGVGFLCDVSRLNVSLTRAKRCLILCGNFSNLNHLPAWKSLLSDARNRNVYYNLTSNEIANFKDNVMKKIII